MKGGKVVFASCHSDIWLCQYNYRNGIYLMSQIRPWVTYWFCNLYFAELLALALMEFRRVFIIMEHRNFKSNFNSYLQMITTIILRSPNRF